MLRYCARPPFALERLRIEGHDEAREERSATPSPGQAAIRQVLYHPARPTRDGRTVLTLSPREFLAAPSRLVPPPRVQRHRYHGALAPNARLREQVVALGRDDSVAPGDPTSSAASDDLPHGTGTAGSDAPESNAPDPPASPQRAAARSRWARLLARSYEVFPLTCTDCGGDMRILAFITAAEPADAILAHLGLPTTPPPPLPRRRAADQVPRLQVGARYDFYRIQAEEGRSVRPRLHP